MRKFAIAAIVILGLAGAGGGAWWGYHRFFRDPLTQAQALLAKGDVHAAVLVLREAVQRHPGNTTAHMRLAMVQLMLGDPLAAERELRAARAAGYKGTDLMPLLARALLAQKRGKEVLAGFVPDGLPPADAADLLVTRGMAALAAGNLEAARDSAEAAERLAPQLPAASLLAARTAVAAHEPGWALAWVDRALTLSPDMTDALLLKAGILRAEGRPAEALPLLDKAVATAKAPVEMASARLSRAGALLAEGEDAKAMADLDALLKQVPKSPGGHYLRLLAQVRAKDWHAADASLQTLQPLLSRLPRGEYYLALVKANLGQLAQASDAIEHYTSRAPGDPDGWRLRARIDLLAGRKEKAAEALAKVTGLAPEKLAEDLPAAEARAETPQALTRLASLQIDAGDAAAAAHDLERSLETVSTPADVAARAVMAALREGDIERAGAALRTLQEQPGAAPERVATLTGAVRLAELDLDGARTAFAAALKVAPESLALQVDLARVLLLQGQATEAKALLAPLLEKAPANPLVLGTMLDIYAVERQPDRARAAIAAARAAQPNNPALILTDAALETRLGNPAGALAKLEAAPADLARSPQVLALKARLLLDQGRSKEAITADQLLLQAAPGNVAARRELADLLLADHQDEAAVAVIREGLKVRPGNSVLLQAYVTVTYRVSGLDAALALADALRRDPANLPAAQLLKGTVYMAANRPADAAAAFAAERAVAPFGGLILAEAAALKAAGQAGQMRALLRDWVARQPDPAVSDALATLEIENSHFDAAVSALQDVLAARPEDVMALNNLAWVYQQLHDPKALALARRAYLLAPANGQIADTLGWILTQQGQPATGALLLRQAAARLPQDPGIQYHLAVALNDAGQRQQASEVLNAILSQDVAFGERDAARQLQQQLQQQLAPATQPDAQPK
jgi:predicted Zn-dependent protease